MDTESDDELWQRAATSGNRDAFAALYHKHARTIYNYIFRRLGNWSEAEDLTAAVFLEAYRRRREVTVAQGKVLPWLFGIATNLVRNQRRSMWSRRRQLDSSRDAAWVVDPVGDPAARLEAQERMRTILTMVARLPREQQDVLALCLWSELSYEDAALALAVPVGTVRSRLSRARVALRELQEASAHEVATNEIQEAS